VIFIILFSLTVYSLISSNEIVRNAELIQYMVIIDLSYLIFLSSFLFINLFKIYKTRKKEVIGLRLFYKFFLFFSIFSIIPSTIILISSLIFFNIEVSTWLGPAFKSTVNNSYLIANKFIKEREDNLITDTNFIKNYILTQRDIDPSIIERFDMETVYLKTNESYKIIYSSESKILLKDANKDFISNKLITYHSTTREYYENQGRITDLILNKTIFNNLKIEEITSNDRVMLCGSMGLNNDLKEILSNLKLNEGANNNPAEFVLEKAFVG